MTNSRLYLTLIYCRPIFKPSEEPTPAPAISLDSAMKRSQSPRIASIMIFCPDRE